MYWKQKKSYNLTYKSHYSQFSQNEPTCGNFHRVGVTCVLPRTHDNPEARLGLGRYSRHKQPKHGHLRPSVTTDEHRVGSVQLVLLIVLKAELSRSR